MPKVKIQATIEIEYEPLISSITPQDVLNSVQKEIEDAVPRVLNGTIETWSVNLKLATELGSIQTEATRSSSSYHLRAFFSSDGPAVLVTPMGHEEPINQNLLYDLNNALREAHHKYLSKVFGD